jgi:hypothetical protein
MAYLSENRYEFLQIGVCNWSFSGWWVWLRGLRKPRVAEVEGLAVLLTPLRCLLRGAKGPFARDMRGALRREFEAVEPPRRPTAPRALLRPSSVSDSPLSVSPESDWQVGGRSRVFRGDSKSPIPEDSPSLDTDQTRAVLTASVSPATARSIETGQTVTVADREVARITQVDVAPGPDTTTRRITLGVELETLAQPGGPAYAGAPLALDRTVSVNPGSYQFQGRIDALGTDQVETETAAVTVGTTLDEEASTRLEVGDTYRIADRSVAEITTIQRFPDPGSDQHQLVLGLELETVRDEGDRFIGPNRDRVATKTTPCPPNPI